MSAGTTNGGDATFTTAPCPPSATTNAASAITLTGATLNGTVNDNGADTTVTFDYGPTTEYGATAAGGTVAANAGNTDVSGTLSGLACNTLYHFRVSATNSSGTTNGGDAMFTTDPCPPDAPTALMATPGDSQAVIAFTAPASDGGSAITNYEYSTDNGTNWTARLPAATTSPVTITGLTNGTTYQIKLRAINNSGAGAASTAVSVTPTAACGAGIALTTGAGALWQQLALPCVPSGDNTVAAIFGSGSASNLTTGDYGTPNPGAGTGWVIERRTVGDTPANVRLLANDAFDPNLGYWIKSFQAPAGGNLSIAGTATPVTLGGGCASANGCAVIPVTTPGNVNRYNLVPNPFPYAVDWSKVRVRVGGSSGTVYSPCQAYGITDGCTGPAAGPASPPVLSNQISIWNGTGYVYPTDLAPSLGNLLYFKSFWVKVLPGASGKTIELLIPAEVSTIGQWQPEGLPWYLAWLDWLAPPAAAETAPITAAAHPQGLPHAGDWYVRLKLDNHVTGWKSYSNLLGQMAGTQAGFDLRDLDAMAPFAKPYLTLVFPHPEWGDKAGDYSADFRPPQPRGKPVDWLFEVRADPVNNGVFLSWEGDPAILKRSRLVDVRTGKTLNVSAGKWAKKGYPIQAKGTVERYIWRYLGP